MKTKRFKKDYNIYQACSIFFVALALSLLIVFVIVNSLSYQHTMLFGTSTVIANGTYKILQLSDTQISSMGEACWHLTNEQKMWPCNAKNTTAFIEALLNAEKPDFVVFAGDNVVGKSQYQVENTLKHLFDPLTSSNTPFGVILGNHDVETSELSVEKIFKFIKRNYPNSLVGNIQMLVKDTDHTLLYQAFLFDYPYSGQKAESGYHYWTPEQISWFNDYVVEAPAVTFGHLPLDVYKHVDPNTIIGDKFEPVYSASGERSLWNAFEGHQILSYSAGHDHVNDFCGYIKGKKPLLCYSGGTGYTTYGKTGWPRRARVFHLNKTHVTTYKVLDDMTKIHFQTIKG